MILYYFTKSIYGLETIRDRRIKISRISSLNDPFELLGFNLRDRNRRKLLNKFKDWIDSEFGLVCMSTDWTHPLMWAHYADMHKGLCLAFEVPDSDSFQRVLYRPDRPDPPSSFSDISKISENIDAMKSNFFSKFTAWEYEREYRLLVELSKNYRDPVTGLYFLPFENNLSLKKVIVGDRSSVSRKQLADVLGEERSDVVCFKARPAFQKFELTENKLKSAWK